jgi:Ca2+-transporting ATPase
MLGAVLLTVLLQLAIIYIPSLRSFFHTDMLSISEIAITIGLSSLIFWFLEGLKLIRKARNR